MSDLPPNVVTRLLREVEQKTPGAVEQLIDLVYTDLKLLASARLRSMPPWELLQPTALVNEAYLKLFGREKLSWTDRKHFFTAASMVMRDIMVDRARRALSLKRGGDRSKVSLDEDALLWRESEQFLEMNELIDELTKLYPRQGRVVEFKLFVGLTEDQIGLALDITPSTVRRDWRLAKAWFTRKLRDPQIQ